MRLNGHADEDPHLLPIDGFLREVHRRVAPVIAGTVADYIPELAHADPGWFGIALVTVAGHVYQVGDTELPFTIQSVSKPFVFGMALDDQGFDVVLRNVGVSRREMRSTRSCSTRHRAARSIPWSTPAPSSPRGWSGGPTGRSSSTGSSTG